MHVLQDIMNLFHEGRAFNLALIERAKNPLIIEAKEILAMATRNAAKALMVEDKLGTLEIGKLADILVLDLRHPRTTPIHGIYNTLLYSYSERDIDKIIVIGVGESLRSIKSSALYTLFKLEFLKSSNLFSFEYHDI
jgi:cytosine/adenosine deaminase-related metal-dependent hydrolase